MNAYTQISPTFTRDLAGMAKSILAGDYSAIPGDERFSDDEEWFGAAQYAADTGDLSELSFMCAREIAFDEWRRLSERTQDAWAGFGNYFEKQRKRIERLPDLPGRWVL